MVALLHGGSGSFHLLSRVVVRDWRLKCLSAGPVGGLVDLHAAIVMKRGHSLGEVLIMTSSEISRRSRSGV